MTARSSLTPRTPGLALRRLPAAMRAWAAARVIDGGVRAPAFLTLLPTLDDAPRHAAATVQLLPDGAAAFARMLDAIGAAEREILLETYILRDDRLGVAVQEALGRAVARGVRVHVLVDAVGSMATADRFWSELEQRGVIVRHFHRFWQHPLETLRRDHRKLLVIDRTIAFTGGMNVGEEYGSSIRKRADVWRDTFVEVRGSVARELAAVFAEGWDRARGDPLPGLEAVRWSDAAEPHAAPHAERGAERAPGEPPLAFVLDPRPGRGQREMLAVLAALVGGARERLWITTPYFAPPTPALRLLILAAHRGVDVRLLLPSRRTDVPIVRHAAHGTYATLLRHGVRVFEYQQATLHAKTVVVDGYVSLIGSSNLDFRSFWWNAECNVLLVDAVCGTAMERTFADDLANSTEITAAAWAQRSLGHRVLDRLARSLRWAL